jgi:hypothetical protein
MTRSVCFAAALATFSALTGGGGLQAQTADDLNERARVEMDWVNGMARLKWWAKSGRTYFVQHTTDLNLPWQWADIVESGNDSWREWGYQIGDQMFFRLKHTDTPTIDPWNDDFDGDKVSNAWELLIGTDPLSFADTDEDSLPDDWETRHGLNPQDPGDASSDSDGDGQTNQDEFENDNDPHVGDGDGDGVDYAGEANVTGTDPAVPDPFLKMPDEQGFAWVNHDEEVNPAPWQFFSRSLSSPTYPAIGSGVRVFVQFESAGGVVDDEFKINDQVIATLGGGSAIYELTSAWNGEGPNAASAVSTMQGGAYLSPFRIVYLPTFQILDKDKNPITELKVGKMAESGVLSGTGSSATLDIDKDSDRFYVRIPGAASMGAVSIKVATVDNPDANYNDDETEIDMQVEGNVLISKSMLLVSDDADDDHQVDSISDDGKNDRTHKVQLGGKFQVKSIKIGSIEHQTDIKTPVPVQKTVNFEVIILRQAAGGAPVIDQADVENDLKIAQERYAQTGIKLTWSINISDPPAGVDLADGLTEFTSNTPTVEEKALFDGLGTASSNDIQVFYVNFLHPAPGSKGEAFPPSYFSLPNDAQYTNNVVMSASQRGPFTLPHELGHILLNDESHDSESIRLMRNGTSLTNGLSESKRISSSQEQTMQGSSHAE